MLFYIFIFLKLNFYDTWQKKKKKYELRLWCKYLVDHKNKKKKT